MEIPHVDLVKEAIGDEAIEVLVALFESRKGEPPCVPVQRFRADNEEWISALDELENRYSLIERSKSCDDYLIRPYALPLLGTQEAAKLLGVMDEIYRGFSTLYKENLSEPLSVDVLCAEISSDRDLVNEALYYLTASHGIYAGMTIGFPYAENSSMSISESVLSKKSISDVLSEYFEWHFVNPKSQITSLEVFASEGDGGESIFFRESGMGAKPDWYKSLGNTQKALIWEIDLALINNLEALPTIGLRTLLETIMVEKLGDIGSFARKVKRFTEEGYVTPKMAVVLSHVLDAGNASAHRAYFPSREDLIVCVDLVKHLMHGIYILKPKVEKVAENTPKRDGT